MDNGEFYLIFSFPKSRFLNVACAGASLGKIRSNYIKNKTPTTKSNSETLISCNLKYTGHKYWRAGHSNARVTHKYKQVVLFSVLC